MHLGHNGIVPNGHIATDDCEELSGLLVVNASAVRFSSHDATSDVLFRTIGVTN